MAKYLVETDQGKFEVETDEPDQSSPDFMAPGGEKSFAEQAVDAITPEVQGPPQNESFLQRLARGTRQAFFPASMDEVKSLANPNLGQFGVSKILEEEGKRLGSAVRSSTANIRDKAPIVDFIPATAGMLGAADVFSDALTPSGTQQNIGAEGVGSVLQAAGPALKKMAVDPARRALGFQKSQLVSQKSPFETTRKIAQANRSADAMLKEGAISPTGNVTDSIENATKILSENSRKLSDVIAAVDDAGKTVKVSKIDSKIIDELKPKFDDEYQAADKILADLKAFGKDGLSLKEVDELKARWGKIGFQDKTVGTTGADMYRKAWGAADKIIKSHIEDVAPDSVAAYKAAKAGQENAINALRGLGNKQAADLGNNVLSLPTKVLAAGQLAAGDIPGAAATAGIAETLKRRGLAPLAVGAYGAGKALEKGVTPGFLSALRSSARRLLDEEKAKGSKPGKNVLMDAIRGSKPGFERKLKGAAEPTRMASAATAPQSGKPLSADNLALVQGYQLYAEGDKEGAKKAWQRALKMNPKNIEARSGLERLAIQERKDRDAYKPR